MLKFAQFQSQFRQTRSIMKVAFHIFVLFTLAACGTKPREAQIATSVATPPITATRLMAMMVGELAIENECLRVNDYLLIWPPDFTVNIQGAIVEIIDELAGEKTIWHNGDTVQVGGGEVSYLSLDEQVRQDVPSHCSKGGAGAFWLVGDTAIPSTITPVVR